MKTKQAGDALKMTVAETINSKATVAVVMGRLRLALGLLEAEVVKPEFNHRIFGADYRKAIDALKAELFN
jgi:hypothetical protein